MPRPRKPTSLHVVAGTLRSSRHRDRQDEPEVIEPLGAPPEAWALDAKLLWAEIGSYLPAGVARKADRLMFETLLRLVAKMREGPEAMTPALAAQLRCACSAFGMTPESRSRVSTPRLPEINAFSQL